MARDYADLDPEFQSAPGGEAGGNTRSRLKPEVPCVFQSAPGGEAGGNQPPFHDPPRAWWFQSAPGGEAGGNCWSTATVLAAGEVSIRPRR